MNRCIFVVPYYGKWPSSFREWAYSAGFLKDQNVDFLLVTDLPIDFELPNNFRILKLSFAELKLRFQEGFSFELSLETPYKLCDFKPAYGRIFQRELQGYDFWGHCDCDLIWGDFRRFLTGEIFEKYDRIQYLGHCVLYRNTPKMNEAFALPGDYYNHETVFSSPLYYSYDEHPGMLNIVIKNNIRNYMGDIIADVSPIYSRIRISRRKNYQHQIVYWQNGRVFRAFVDENGELQQEEFLYFHFQKKYPCTLPCWDAMRKPSAFILYGDRFEEIGSDIITAEFVRKHSDFTSSKKDLADKYVYYYKKILGFVTMPFKEKLLWIRLRSATKKATSKIPDLMR